MDSGRVECEGLSRKGKLNGRNFHTMNKFPSEIDSGAH